MIKCLVLTHLIWGIKPNGAKTYAKISNSLQTGYLWN